MTGGTASTLVPWQLLYKDPGFALLRIANSSAQAVKHIHYRHKYGMAKHIFYALFLELLFTGTLTRDPVSEQLQNYRRTNVST
jgi:hypothetical protein